MQQLTVTLNLKRGLCRISTPLYLGGEYAVSYTPDGTYSLVMTEPFADSPREGLSVWAQTDSSNTLRLTRKALHNAFVRADSRQPGMTLSAKVFVLDESGATVADGTATIEFSPAQYIIDDAEYPTAREILGQAQNAVSEAKHSVLMAQTAQSGAERAKSEAQEAKSQAQTSRDEAKVAQTAADKSASEAKASADTAKAAKSAAETAQTAAESAKSEAQAAADNASTAATEAVKAETDRAKSAEEEIKRNFAALVGEDAGKTIRETADAVASALISGVVDGAPEALDTLKEIAEWIAKDETGTQSLLTQITGLTNLVTKKADITAVANSLNGKVDKVTGKGLSTNDYTTADKEKLASITDEEGFVKKSRYAETALDANNATFANHSEHANNAELATASQSSMALFPYSDGGSYKNQRSAKLIFSQIDEKRKLNDNTAAVDSTVFTEWKFSDGKSYSMSIEPNVPMSDPVTGETVEGYVYYFDANSYYPSAFFQVIAYTVDENPLELKFDIYGEALSIWPNGLSATREKVVITKSGESYVTPTGVENIAIPKYEFIDAAIVDGKVTVAPYTNAKLVSDGTAFSVAVGESDGKTRDCVLRVECGDTAPTITWGANFHPRTDADTDFKCEAGKRNVYWITEHTPNEFCVAGWQETTGGNAQ